MENNVNQRIIVLTFPFDVEDQNKSKLANIEWFQLDLRVNSTDAGCVRLPLNRLNLSDGR